MFWILNPHVKMMKPINKFFVQSRECPRSYMKQISSFMLKMHCECTLISTRGSQASGRKQHWPRHGKLELSKKLHSTKKKNPQLLNINSFGERMPAHSSHAVTYSSVPKVNSVRVSWPRDCCTTSGERDKCKKNSAYNSGDPDINLKIYHFK